MPPPNPDDKRSLPQRRADALVELSDQALDSGSLPQKGGQKPHLHQLAELAALQKLPGAPAPELNREQMVTGEAVRRIGCDSGIT